MQAAAAGPSRVAALTLTLGAHLLDMDRVPLSISALTLSHAFVPPEALAALVARHLAFQAWGPALASCAGVSQAEEECHALSLRAASACHAAHLHVLAAAITHGSLPNRGMCAPSHSCVAA